MFKKTSGIARERQGIRPKVESDRQTLLDLTRKPRRKITLSKSLSRNNFTLSPEADVVV
jgi:hypothetical protein